MRKPTEWGPGWDKLPVLALPGIHGWQLYEAIRERAAFVYGDDWTSNGLPPDEVLSVAPEWNPNRDYKEIECAMYGAIGVLLPQYVNYTHKSRKLWTMSDALAYLRESSRKAPNPYYLSAKWLWQSYKLVNLMRKVEDIISISWIDEAEPVYIGDSEVYRADKELFEQKITFTVAVIQPGGGSSGEIIGSSGTPRNVRRYTCPRDPCRSMSSFLTAFDTLKSQYTRPRLTVGLFVDSSGSMSKQTIEPAYSHFIEYIRTNYPLYRIIEREAGDERWLIWTMNYINELNFRFEAEITGPPPSES